MSTRSIIGRTIGHEGQFSGRYVHSDGAPTDMGAWLWQSLRGHFRNDLKAMLRYLIDAPHAICGWSALTGKDLSLSPGYTWQRVIGSGKPFAEYSQLPDYRRPQCFASRPGETEDTRTEKDLQDTDCEFLYVFDVEQCKLFVRDLRHDEDVAVIDLDGEEPKWEHVECGGPDENWRRCNHVASHHGIDSPLGMQTYLGNRPLDPIHDALGYVIAGKNYTATGSGGSSEYMRGHNPVGTWVASLIAQNNRRIDLPIAKYVSGKTRGEYQLLANVQAIYPPTKEVR